MEFKNPNLQFDKLNGYDPKSWAAAVGTDLQRREGGMRVECADG
jgi:hypothetical protein